MASLPDWRVKGSFKVLDDERWLFPYYCDDIEAHRKIDGVTMYVNICRFYDSADFPVGHSLFRRTELFALACFHFDEDHQLVSAFSNDVDVFLSASPVAVADVVAFFCEMSCRSFFAFLAQLIVCCHFIFTLAQKYSI